MTASIQPPKYPEDTPMMVPSETEIRTTRKPMESDIFEPYITRLRISRPYWSVPNIKVRAMTKSGSLSPVALVVIVPVPASSSMAIVFVRMP